jgi:hypothetical protein
MTPQASSTNSRWLPDLRRLLLGVLLLGLLGSGTELLLLAHYEDTLQLIPLALIAVALLVLLWHGLTRNRVGLRFVQATMVGLVVGGGAGMVLHYRGNLEFQAEMHSSGVGWPQLLAALRAKSPPALAPGALAQLGLLGLVYSSVCGNTRSHEAPAASSVKTGA